MSEIEELKTQVKELKGRVDKFEEHLKNHEHKSQH
jgi:hypothetical protein